MITVTEMDKALDAELSEVMTPAEIIIAKGLAQKWQSKAKVQKKEAVQNPTDDVKTLMLPSWCIVIPWFLVLSLTVTCAVLTVLYTFSFGADKSLAWLRSFLFTLFGEILIEEPLTVVGIALFLAFVIKRSDVEYFDLRSNKEWELDPEKMESVVAERVAVKLLRLDPVFLPPWPVSCNCNPHSIKPPHKIGKFVCRWTLKIDVTCERLS